MRTSLDTADADRGAESRCAPGLLRYRRRARVARPDRHDRSRQRRPDRASSPRPTSASTTRTGASAWSPRAAAPSATIGFADGDEAPLTGLPDAIKVGDVTAVAPSGNAWAVRTVPEVSGRLPRARTRNTGRVLAMQGGFDFRLERLQPRHPGAAPAGLDDQAVRLCHRARPRDDPGDDGPRPDLSASTRAPTSARSASATSAARAAASTPCAGGSSSRAT